jgi:dehydrogenase/reductase SDR family protein 7
MWIRTWRAGAAAAVAGGSAWFWSQLDCDPGLYARNRLFCTEPLRRDFFRGKVVWILGASSGIGEELAFQLASLSAGTRLYLSSRPSDRLECVADRCRNIIRSGNIQEDSRMTGEDEVSSVVQVVPVDVTDEASLREAIQTVSDREIGGVDIIFLNAGRGHLSPAAGGFTSVETTRRVVEQTALWPMVATPLLLPLFRDPGKPAHLVVTSSIAAVLPVPLSAVYAASKHALRGYFASLQAECPLGERLRVDMICPGPVDTDFHRPREPDSLPHGSTRRSATEDAAAAEAPSSGSGAAAAPRSPLKMSTHRCVELVVSAVAWPSDRGRTAYLSPQPALTFAYLYPLLPAFAADRLLRAVGTRRVQLWRDGLDLYDPASWRKRQPRR